MILLRSFFRTLSGPMSGRPACKASRFVFIISELPPTVTTCAGPLGTEVSPALPRGPGSSIPVRGRRPSAEFRTTEPLLFFLELVLLDLCLLLGLLDGLPEVLVLDRLFFLHIAPRNVPIMLMRNVDNRETIVQHTPCLAQIA